MSESYAPYRHLGDHLRFVREQSQQSLSEVSGAVEIDEQELARIEAGIERPAEDILLLLISYFGVKDREAVQLWELAEYDSDIPDEIRIETETVHMANKPTVMLLAMDMRTMYSDGVEIAVTPGGVTLNFTQATNPTQTAPVARVGMSHHQAEMVIKAMQQALLQAKYNSGPRLLPPTNPEA